MRDAKERNAVMQRQALGGLDFYSESKNNRTVNLKGTAPRNSTGKVVQSPVKQGGDPAANASHNPLMMTTGNQSFYGAARGSAQQDMLSDLESLQLPMDARDEAGALDNEVQLAPRRSNPQPPEQAQSPQPRRSRVPRAEESKANDSV